MEQATLRECPGRAKISTMTPPAEKQSSNQKKKKISHYCAQKGGTINLVYNAMNGAPFLLLIKQALLLGRDDIFSPSVWEDVAADEGERS